MSMTAREALEHAIYLADELAEAPGVSAALRAIVPMLDDAERLRVQLAGCLVAAEGEAVKDVREIVEAFLRVNGYKGLAGYECGCGLDDLMPCDGEVADCQPAFKRECYGCGNDACEWRGNDDHGCYAAPVKP